MRRDSVTRCLCLLCLLLLARAGVSPAAGDALPLRAGVIKPGSPAGGEELFIEYYDDIESPSLRSIAGILSLHGPVTNRLFSDAASSLIQQQGISLEMDEPVQASLQETLIDVFHGLIHLKFHSDKYIFRTGDAASAYAPYYIPPEAYSRPVCFVSLASLMIDDVSYLEWTCWPCISDDSHTFHLTIFCSPENWFTAISLPSDTQAALKIACTFWDGMDQHEKEYACSFPLHIEALTDSCTLNLQDEPLAIGETKIGQVAAYTTALREYVHIDTLSEAPNHDTVSLWDRNTGSYWGRQLIGSSFFARRIPDTLYLLVERKDGTQAGYAELRRNGGTWEVQRIVQ